MRDLSVVAITITLSIVSPQCVAADSVQSTVLPQACERFIGTPPKFGTEATQKLIRECTLAMLAIVDANWTHSAMASSNTRPADRSLLEARVAEDRAHWHKIIECRLTDRAHPYANMAEAAVDLEHLARAGLPLPIED
jgi:hypothetical protein